MIKIDDYNDKRIEYYKNLRFTPDIHSENNIFITESVKLCTTLLKSNLKIISFLAPSDFYHKNIDLFRKKRLKADNMYHADKEIINKIVGFKHHTGVLAIAKQPDKCGLNDLQNHIIALNGVNNAENVGSIIRNAVSFGFNSFIFDKQTCSPFLRRSVRVSMGAVFNIKHHYTESLADSIKLSLDSGYSIISAEISEKSISINDIVLPKKSVIVFGSEDKGIEQEILSLSSLIAYIPIIETDSLNVASASAVILYELSKKRLPD